MNGEGLTRARSILENFGIVDVEHLATRPLTECFVGTQQETSKRLFIKLMNSQLAGVESNFLREIDVLERVKDVRGCPNLIAASREPAFIFHACEYQCGTTIEQAYLRSAPTTLDSVLRVASTLETWIDQLHDHGFAHRDISPEHVFLDGAGEVTVVDFGLARPLHASSAKARLDIGYDRQAWAMVICEMLSGRPIFRYRGHALEHEIRRELDVLREIPLPAKLADAVERWLSIPSELVPAGVARRPTQLPGTLRGAQAYLGAG